MSKSFFFPLMRGSELVPPRFWGRTYASSKKELRRLKKYYGWVTDRSKNAITREDINERTNSQNS